MGQRPWLLTPDVSLMILYRYRRFICSLRHRILEDSQTMPEDEFFITNISTLKSTGVHPWPASSYVSDVITLEIFEALFIFLLTCSEGEYRPIQGFARADWILIL